MSLPWDSINFRVLDPGWMIPEFTFINGINLYIVYGLFFKNEGEIIIQIPKEQVITKVMYLLEQMAEPHIQNVVSLWCNSTSHHKQFTWKYLVSQVMTKCNILHTLLILTTALLNWQL